jgi:hypothetical protein
MKQTRDTLTEILDENVLVKTVFVRKNGKLKMIHKKLAADEVQLVSNKPMFPISKVRQ